jgi:hypothetical protein
VVVPVIYDIFDETIERFSKKKKNEPNVDTSEVIEQII